MKQEAVQSQFHYLQNLPLGICIADTDYTVIFWNNTLEKWTGIAEEEIIGQKLTERFDNLQQPKYTSRINGLASGGPAVIFSSQLHPHFIPAEMSNGRLRVQHTTVNRVRMEDSSEHLLMFSIQDVTETVRHLDRIKSLRKEALAQIEERKKAEEALRASETKYRALFRNLPTGVFHFDTKGVITTANTALAKILQAPLDQLIGLRLYDLPNKEIVRCVDETLEGESAHFEGHYISKLSGHELYAKADFAPVFLPDGEVMGGVGIVEDVTERITTTRELQERENQYRLMVEASEEVFFYIHDTDHRFTYLSPSVKNVTGYEQEELLNQPYELILNEDHPMAEQVHEKTNQTLETGEKSDIYTAVISHKNGDSIFLELVESPLFTNGEVSGIQGFARDITNRMKAEQELLESKEMLDSINRNIKEGIFRFKPDEGMIYANDALARIFRYTDAESVTAYSLPDFFVNNSEVLSILKELDGQESIINREVHLKRRDGSRLWGLMSLTAVTDKNGKVQYFDGALTDITERKQAEFVRSALYRIAEKTSELEDIGTYLSEIHSIVEELMPARNFFVARVNAERTVLDFSYYVDEYGQPKMREHFGRGVTEFVIEQESPELLTASDLREMADEGAIEVIGKLPESLLSVPILTADQVLGVITVQDYHGDHIYTTRDKEILTFVAQHLATALQRIQYEDNLLKSKEEAEAANRAKSIFLANVSHELRTPLNSIIGFSRRILRRSAGKIGDRSEQALEVVQRNAQNLLQLINDLLDFSKIEAGKMHYNMQKVEVRELVENTLAELEPLASAKNLDVIHTDSDSYFVNADPVRLKQVLLNIIGNAIKFTDDGSVEVTLSPVETRGNELLQITVTDTGPGIPKEKLRSIFDVFEQVDHSNENQKGGTGLGLSISERIMNDMNGQIMAESELGEGTTFRIQLPIVKL